MQKFKFFWLFFLIHFGATMVLAQNKVEILLKNSTAISTIDSLPFWFVANQLGKVEVDQGFLNLSELYLGQKKDNKPSLLSYQWGVLGVAGLSKTSYLQLNQAFGGISWQGWQLEAGLFSDKEQFGGLSTTNGNMARSLNARPYPKVRFSTVKYRPLPWVGQWLQFKAEWDEGILNEAVYVANARLHHKSLYGAITPGKGWQISAGLEHFVLWGGVSPNPTYGEMPHDLNAYWLYISASPGNEAFPETDRINVAGNQLGTYQLQVSKEFKNWKAEIYVSHPYEDYSGIVWRNYPDNLIGLHVVAKEKKHFVNELVYEFMDTRQQSVQDSFYKWNEAKQLWETMESDNYYNHGVYRSGFTYQKRMLGTPLFQPKFSENGAIYFTSNRFYTHHLGVLGCLSENLTWKAMATITHQFGTYWKPYPLIEKEYSLLLNLCYHSPKLPFEISVATAADFGNVLKSNLGVQVSVARKW